MAAPDGNVQDMSVHDKEHPSLAATEEAQNVAGLDRIVAGMPAYTDPHNPMTLSGSVNLPLDQHPVTHDPDYGKGVLPGTHAFDGGHSPQAVGAATLTADSTLSLPADREEWTKANWQAQARSLNLPTSGNTDAIKARVEDHESMQEAVDARQAELAKMNREELDDAGRDAGLDPASFSNMPDLSAAILDAERTQAQS